MKKFLLVVAVICMTASFSFAKGQQCQGDWNCSYDEYCHKPSWKKGTCVEEN